MVMNTSLLLAILSKINLFMKNKATEIGGFIIGKCSLKNIWILDRTFLIKKPPVKVVFVLSEYP